MCAVQSDVIKFCLRQLCQQETIMWWGFFYLSFVNVFSFNACRYETVHSTLVSVGSRLVFTHQM